MANKHVDLFKDIIPSVDLNIRELWDAATDDGRKEIKNDMWNLNRYISSVKMDSKTARLIVKKIEQEEGRKITEAEAAVEVQRHFILSVNEYYNKNWNLFQKDHPKLLWMLLCMCNFDAETTFFHEWIPLSRTKIDKKARFLLEIFPNTKSDEIELLAAINTEKDLKELGRKHGMDDATIAKKLK